MEHVQFERLAKDIERIADALEVHNALSMFGAGMIIDSPGSKAMLQSVLNLSTEAVQTQHNRMKLRKSVGAAG